MVRNLVKSFILLASAALASCQEDMIVSIDPTVVVSSIKPMNAANNGPVKANMESYAALQIPYARPHDAALTEVYVAKRCVDVSAVFPDWDAPVDDPASYEFVPAASLDMQMRGLPRRGLRICCLHMRCLWISSAICLA